MFVLAAIRLWGGRKRNLLVLSVIDVSRALFCTLVASVLHVEPTTLYFIVLLLRIHSWLSLILEYYKHYIDLYIHHSPQMKNLILPFQYFIILPSNTENNSNRILFFYSRGRNKKIWGGGCLLALLMSCQCQLKKRTENGL